MLIEHRADNLNSSYGIVFGNSEVGNVISKVQAAMIALGYELERYIRDNCPIDGIEFKKRIDIEGQKRRIEPDFFYDDGSTIHVGEIKFGKVFDTKKSGGEIENLYKLKRKFENEGREVELYFCSYMAPNEMEVINGLKGRATNDINVLYGPVFFDWFDIDYNAFEEKMKDVQKANWDYFYNAINEIKLQMESLGFS